MTRPCLLAVLLFVLSCLSACGGGVRAPAFRYVKDREGGCGNVFFYKGTADGREVLWISADRKALGLTAKGSKTFDLASAPRGLTVAVDLWDKSLRKSHYCNDVADDTRKGVTWHAKKGKVTITIGGEVDSKEPRRYQAGVRLEGVLFEDGAGHQATLREETIADVTVGWYAG